MATNREYFVAADNRSDPRKAARPQPAARGAAPEPLRLLAEIGALRRHELLAATVAAAGYTPLP